MSLDATRVALHQPPQNIMQQLMAAIAMSKQVQARTAQQRQQALEAQTPPTVAQQLQAAAPMPPEMSGIAATAPEGSVPAMAAGGFVQRNFEGGGVADTDDYTSVPGMVTGDPYTRAMEKVADGAYKEGEITTNMLKLPRAIWDLDKAGVRMIRSGLSAAVDKAKKVYTTPAGEYKEPDPKATNPYPPMYGPNTPAPVADKNPAPKPAKSGLAAAAKPATETVSEATKDPHAPAPSPYADRAKELQKRLDPLYAAQLANIKGQRDNENTRYAGLQKARELSTSDKLIELGDQFTRAAQASAGTPGGGNGLRGLAAYGSIALKDRKAREADENKEAFAHLEKIGVIDSHSTDKQIAQAVEAYKTFNTAYGADDKTELNAAKLANAAKTAEAAELRAEAAKVTADAKAKKGAGGGGAGGPKPMTWDQAQRAARARVKMIEDANAKDMGERPVPDIDTLARQLMQGPGAAVQSGNPAAGTPARLKYNPATGKIE
jgi:hypothetical protein